MQGAIGTTADYQELADALADRLTVHVPERRGRPLSPAPFDPVHAIDREVEDLQAVLAAGDCQWIVGLSPGAVITLEAARRYPSLRELVPTMRFDFGVVTAMQDRFETFRAIRADVLLLSCRGSPTYLREACARLAEVIPSSRTIEFATLDHSGPWNRDRGGRPELVAAAIRDFFLA